MSEWGLSGGGGVDVGYNQIEQAKMARMPTLQQRLDLAVKQAEEKLNAAKEARELLARNPDLERLLDIMQRSHF